MKTYIAIVPFYTGEIQIEPGDIFEFQDNENLYINNNIRYKRDFIEKNPIIFKEHKMNKCFVATNEDGKTWLYINVKSIYKGKGGGIWIPKYKGNRIAEAEVPNTFNTKWSDEEPTEVKFIKI